MASLGDLSGPVRFYLKRYRFERWAGKPRELIPPRVPPDRRRVAVVTTAGLYRESQTRFDRWNRRGDVSFRVLETRDGVAGLRIGQKSHSFDPAGIRADANLVLPLDRLEELAREGTIGSVAPRHLSFSGSITDPRPLLDQSAPEAARLLATDGVDVAVLTPV